MKQLKKSDFTDWNFYTTYRMKFILSEGIKDINGIILRLEQLVELFKKWKETGVKYEYGAEDDYATFSVKGIEKAIELNFDFLSEEKLKLLDYGSGHLYLDNLNNPINLDEDSN